MALVGPRRYSERLGVIDGTQLDEACARFDLGSVEDAAPASSGLWGQNILLTTTEGEFVLRGNPEPPHQLRKERAVAEALFERSSLAVPWPYLVDDDTDLFGWTYALMPLLPGRSGAVLWTEADDRARVELAAAHGDALARLHQTTFPAAGPYEPDHDRFVPADYRTWTLERIDSLRGLCRAVDALTSADERFIDALVESSASALEEPFDPVVVHHDFSLANLTYTQAAGRGYSAAGVFDFGEAHIGDGDEDLVRFLFRREREQRHAFVETYRRARPARPGATDRVALYGLADLLFMWNVSHRVTNWFADSQFVDVAVPVIENAQAASP